MDPLPEPGPPQSIAHRWESPPQFDAVPAGATPEQKLRLRFGYLPPAVGTVARIEWDRLGMDDQP